MNPLDKNYLSLQFKLKVHSKVGTEYHSFFENIMEKAYPDYQKIRPYGIEGDGGNDGYRKDVGIYYQVYAPNEPQLKESDAAKKLQEDFEKLKCEWDEISNIKEYCFVFNDKYRGSVKKIEEVLSNLKKNNSNIEFKVFLPRHLELIFFKLDEADILSLDFNIDRTRAISIANKFLEIIESEFDKDNINYALKILDNVKEIISSLDDEILTLEYELLKFRALQKNEKIDEAVRGFENISIRYPHDPRALLYLASIYLRNNDFDRNKKLLEKAEKIDSIHWLLKLEQLYRINHLGKKIREIEKI